MQQRIRNVVADLVTGMGLSEARSAAKARHPQNKALTEWQMEMIDKRRLDRVAELTAEVAPEV